MTQMRYRVTNIRVLLILILIKFLGIGMAITAIIEDSWMLLIVGLLAFALGEIGVVSFIIKEVSNKRRDKQR